MHSSTKRNSDVHNYIRPRSDIHKLAFNHMIWTILLYPPYLKSNETKCDNTEMTSFVQKPLVPHVFNEINRNETSFQNYKKKIKRALRVLKRIFQLLFTIVPVASLYPIHQLTLGTNSSDESRRISSDWYLKLCLQCVEWSGAATIKLMQWASSRPDLFGSRFCSVFRQLQDHTTPHAIEHTCQVMEKAYGPDWEKKIRLSHVLGSGCIGQVYKGQVINEEGTLNDVAIKVIHPNVRDHIDTDLDILRGLAYSIDNLPLSVCRKLKWLNLQGMADEFASMLEIQLDLRTEAKHLKKFNENFANNPDVVFPEVIDGYEAHPDVLIESFCDGIPVTTYANQNKEDEIKLAKLCNIGIRTVCKMIFEDNFVHSDLHPGNIFVSPDGKKLIVLDAGIVTEHTDSDHELIVSILTSFINNDGRRAGRLMIEDSNHKRAEELKDSVAVDEDGYIRKIEKMTKTASENYLMENLGSYISYICEAASSHHVMINQSFVSICLAVKVQEGVALCLDPTCEIWRIANPIIVRAAFERKVSKSWAKIKNELEEFINRRHGAYSS